MSKSWWLLKKKKKKELGRSQKFKLKIYLRRINECVKDFKLDHITAMKYTKIKAKQHLNVNQHLNHLISLRPIKFSPSCFWHLHFK